MIGLQAMCFWAIMSFNVIRHVFFYEHRNYLEYVVERRGE